MKTKKLISIVLSAVMLLSVFSVCAFAGVAVPFEITGSKLTAEDLSNFSAANFNFKYTVSTDNFEVVNGTKDFVGDITARVYVVDTAGNKVYQDVDAAAFAAVFDGSQKELFVSFSGAIDAEKAFGTISCSYSIGGFYKGELTENTQFFALKGTASLELSEVTAVAINDAIPIAYTDAGKVDLSGVSLAITIDGTSYNYIPAAGNSAIHTDPAVLTVDTNTVDIYFGDILIKDDYAITVSHKYSTTNSSISGTYHACVCEGCGAVDESTIAEHTFDGWTADNNASFFYDETETGTCTVCGGTASRVIEDTAGYNQYKDITLLYVIFDYIHLLLNTIHTSIGR